MTRVIIYYRIILTIFILLILPTYNLKAEYISIDRYVDGFNDVLKDNSLRGLRLSRKAELDYDNLMINFNSNIEKDVNNIDKTKDSANISKSFTTKNLIFSGNKKYLRRFYTLVRNKFFIDMTDKKNSRFYGLDINISYDRLYNITYMKSDVHITISGLKVEFMDKYINAMGNYLAKINRGDDIKLIKDLMIVNAINDIRNSKLQSNIFANRAEYVSNQQEQIFKVKYGIENSGEGETYGVMSVDILSTESYDIKS